MKRDGASGWLRGPWPYILNRAAAPLIPLDVMYRFFVPGADVFRLLWHSKRHAAQRNYARILETSDHDPRVGRLSQACFRHFGRYLAEMINVQGWDTEFLLERLEIDGEEHFAQAESYKKGIIFASAHMGSAEVAAAVAVLRGYKVTSVTQELRPRFVMDWAVACRSRMGITLLPVGGAGIKLLRALRRNGMVAFVVDAGVEEGGGVPVTFLGRETVFPVGPARLARLSGAPIVFGLAVRRPGGRFRVHICPPLLSDRKLDAQEDQRRLTQRLAEMFEGFVRRYPQQWYVFRDIWPD